MNSNLGKSSNPQRGSASMNNFDFDFGLGPGFSNNRSRPLNDQKQTNSPFSSASSYSSAQSKPASWASNKPSWTHQPVPSQPARPGLSNPVSMVGDISGKSWNSTPPSGRGSGIGIVEKNPNLFGDLVGSALGQGKINSSNVPLKNAPPVSAPMAAKNSYSMGNLADSLPKTNTSSKNTNWGSSENLGSYSTVNNNNSSKIGNLGGVSMRSGASATTKKDPFGSLVDFGSKKDPAGSVNAAATRGNSNVDYSFGDFQNATKSSTQFPGQGNNSVGSNVGSGPKMNDYGVFDIPIQDFTSEKQPPPPQAKGVDPLDMLFSSSSASVAAAATTGSDGHGSQPFSEVEDWGLDSEFGGNDMSSTTELEGLPPPPVGVTASAAKNKGLDSHKQGQHADAIKWLSWAVVLLEKAEDSSTTMEVLSSRASCYKEVGEYKKAIADCSKVLEQDTANISVLIQRALLYESTEKYKLGAEDLRTVMKIDPSNRLARSTIHRLSKLAD